MSAVSDGVVILKQSAESWIRRLTIVPWTLLLGFLIVYPIGILVVGSFSRESPRALTFSFDTLTLANYAHILASPGFRAALMTSAEAAAGGALLAVLTGLLFALLVAKTDFPAKALVETIVLVPFFVSPLLGAIAWSVLGSRNSGLLNIVFRAIGLNLTTNISTMAGVIIVFSIYYAPYAYLLLVSALGNIDASLEEAAVITGASKVQTLRHVVFPLAQRAIFSSFLLVFVTMLSLYAIPFVIGEPGHLTFLTTYLWRLLLQSPADYQTAASLSVMLIVISLAGLAGVNRLLGSRNFATIGGRGHRVSVIRLGRWRYMLALPVIGYILLSIVLPYFAIAQATFRNFLFFQSVADLFSTKNLTLAHLAGLFTRPIMKRSIENSLFVGLAVALTGAALSLAVAYVVQRTTAAGRRLLEFIAMMPIAVPSLVIGIAYLWAWIGVPVGLYGTIWILVLAYVSRLLPEGVQGISANLVQVDRSLEEAARACGSSTVRVLRSVVFPLIRPGVAATAILLLILSVREIGPSLFLYNSGTVVMAVQVLSSWEIGDLGGAAALSLVQSLLLTAIVLFARYVLRISLRVV